MLREPDSLTAPTRVMVAVDPHAESVLTSALADGPYPYPAVKRFWERDRRADETVLDFLVRHDVMQAGATKTIQMIAKGYLRIDPKSLVSPDALRKLDTRSTVVPPVADQPTAHQNIEPVRPPVVRTKLSSHPHGSNPSVTPKSRIGQKMGRCLITRLLGEGGGGVVYEGLHQGLGIPVALKVLRDDARGQSIRQALRAEARLLAHLDHPNIVRVFDFDDDGPVPFLVMELVDGQTLADQIRQMGALRVEHATGVIAQTARGLEAARLAGVIHRDVKPSNILIAKSGTVKIADLGLAVSNRIELREECGVGGTLGAGLGGTYAYMAPERFSSRGEVEFYSDLYSLGVTFFEAVTGRIPFRGATPFEYMVAHATADVPDVCHWNRDVPETIAKVITRLLAKESRDRYTSYPELIAELIRAYRPTPGHPLSSTWNTIWDGITLEMSGIIPASQLSRPQPL